MRSRPSVKQSLYGLILFLHRVLKPSNLRSRNNSAEDQEPTNDSRIEAVATTHRCALEDNWGGTPEIVQSKAAAKTPPSRVWARVGDRWWFLGDDNEMKMISRDARPSRFFRSFIPKRLRKFDVLQLDTERLLWVFSAEDSTFNENFVHCQIPYYICGLPVVVLLPRSPCQIVNQSVLHEVQIEHIGALKADDLNSLWKIFPFASGICIWMSGHIQLLAPHLSNAEIAALVIPSQAAGLQVSISRWSPAPTAAESYLSSHKTQSNASFSNAMGSKFFIKRRDTDSGRHLQSARLGEAAPTSSMNGNSPHDDSAHVMKSSSPPSPNIWFSSSHQLIPTLGSSSTQQAMPGPVLSQSKQSFHGGSNAVTTNIVGKALGSSSRLKIGNTISTAGVKVKMNSGPFAGRAFISASTHAVIEGKTGKRLRTRSASNKKKKTKKPFARLFGFRSTPEAITLAGVEVHDLHGNVVSES